MLLVVCLSAANRALCQPQQFFQLFVQAHRLPLGHTRTTFQAAFCRFGLLLCYLGAITFSNWRMEHTCPS